MIQQSIKTRRMLRQSWAKRALQVTRGACGALGGAGGGYAFGTQAEFAVLVGEELAPTGALTCDLLEAYRWLHCARIELARSGPGAPDGTRGGSEPRGNTLERLWIGWRRGPREPWRRQGPLLSLPELTLEGGRLDPVPLVATPLAASPRAARARLLKLLRRGGLDAPASSSLLHHYEGFFPSIEVGVAQILHARLGGDLTWLRWLDLRAMLCDLIAAAALWTLPDRGERGWPAGLHLFSS